MNLKLDSGRQEIPGRTLGRDGSEGLHPRKVGESTGRGDPRRFGGGARGGLGWACGAEGGRVSGLEDAEMLCVMSLGEIWRVWGVPGLKGGPVYRWSQIRAVRGDAGGRGSQDIRGNWGPERSGRVLRAGETQSADIRPRPAASPAAQPSRQV